jgi:hypothetical protein
MRKLIPALVLAALLVGAAAPALADSGGHLEGYVPAVAHADGKFDAFWTTDVWIYQQGATVIHLWLNPPGQDNTNGDSVVVTLDEPVVFLPDVVASVFGTEGAGSLHYLADGPVTVSSRTWTPGQEGGSYGLSIPGRPITSASIPGTGQAGAQRVVVNKNSDFRANYGLVNVSAVPASVLVEIFTADGEPAPGNNTSFTVNLEPFGMTQINDILRRVTGGDQDGLIIRASVTSVAGAILSYLTDVNNTTNDSSYQGGFRFAF